MMDGVSPIAVLVVLVALVIVVRVAFSNSSLRTRLEKLEREHESLGHYAMDLARRFSETEAELRKAQEQIRTIPHRTQQVRDREEIIRRLRTEISLLNPNPRIRGEATSSALDEWREQM